MTIEDQDLLWELNYAREPGNEQFLPDYPILEQLERLAFLDDRWVEYLEQHVWNRPALMEMLTGPAQVEFLKNLNLPPPPKSSPPEETI
jgi:hypothetical protein